MENDKFAPHEILAEVLPDILKEGPVLVEFKSDEPTDIRSAMILTLHPEMCPIENKPVDNESHGLIWCWNAHRGGWYLLNCFDVDNAQNWPPVFEPELE